MEGLEKVMKILQEKQEKLQEEINEKIKKMSEDEKSIYFVSNTKELQVYIKLQEFMIENKIAPNELIKALKIFEAVYH